MRPAFDAILFDFDGVLVDSEPVHHWAWREVLARFGVELPWERYAEQCIGRDVQSIIRNLAGVSGGSVSFEALAAEYPGKIAACRQRMLDAPPVFPDTIALINSISLPMAVVTSNLREEVEPILNAIGIRARLAACVFREDVTKHKPAPDLYLRAAELLNAHNPLVVEDSEAGLLSRGSGGFRMGESEEPALDGASGTRAPCDVLNEAAKNFSCLLY